MLSHRLGSRLNAPSSAIRSLQQRSAASCSRPRISTTLNRVHRRIDVQGITDPISISNNNIVIISTIMSSQTQKRSHAGHGHHHHHTEPSALLSADKSDPAYRITRLGLVANVFMAIGKGVGGYMFSSAALLADAAHSLTDLVSDFMTLATIRFSKMEPTKRFPLGYGKIEGLGSVGVSGMLVLGGVGMGIQSGSSLLELSGLMAEIGHLVESLPQWATGWLGVGGHSHGGHGHGHSHSHTDLGPNVNAIWIALGSILIKEYLYRATLKIAIAQRSSVLSSNALHHRIDSLSSFVALLAIGGGYIYHGAAAFLDPIGGMIISWMVIKGGWGNTKQALYELVDCGIAEDIKAKVSMNTEKAILELNGITYSDWIPDRARTALGERGISVREVQGIKSGQNYLVDIEVAVPKDYRLLDCEDLEEVVREKVGKRVTGMRRVRVKCVTTAAAGRGHHEHEHGLKQEFVPMDVSQRSSREPSPAAVSRRAAWLEEKKKEL